jgi:thioredoxin 1
MIIVERYTAIYCGPCKMLAPTMDSIKNSYADNPNVKFEVIDIDEHAERATKNGVRGVPTVIIRNNGVEANRLVGVQSRATYVNTINALLVYE